MCNNHMACAAQGRREGTGVRVQIRHDRAPGMDAYDMNLELCYMLSTIGAFFNLQVATYRNRPNELACRFVPYRLREHGFRAVVSA